MADSPARSSATIRTRLKRKQFLMDGPIQFGIAGRIVSALLGVGVLYALGIYFLLGEGSMDLRSPDEVRRLILSATAIYFALGMAIVALVTLLLTHRVAGPAFVISNALEGMLEGDYDRRLSLRDHDYLQELATRLQDVRSRWSEREEQFAKELDTIESALLEGRADAVREALERLRGSVREGRIPPECVVDVHADSDREVASVA